MRCCYHPQFAPARVSWHERDLQQDRITTAWEVFLSGVDIHVVHVGKQLSLAKAAFFDEPYVEVVERSRQLFSVLPRGFGVPKHDASLRSVCELAIHRQICRAHRAHEVVIGQRVFRLEAREPIPSRSVGARPPWSEERVSVANRAFPKNIP